MIGFIFGWDSVTLGRHLLWLAFLGGLFQWQRFMVLAHVLGRYGERRLVFAGDALYGVLLSWGSVLYALALYSSWAPTSEEMRTWLLWVLPYVIGYPPCRLLAALHSIVVDDS